MADPIWLARARNYLGLREIPGSRHNSQILKWWQAIKAPFRDDETSWCGGFVGGIMVESGLPVVKGAPAARSWLNYGKPLAKPVVGCIVIFWRGNPKGWSGHVGFVVGVDRPGNLMVLGGNQGDMVSIKPFGRERVLGYRWPGADFPAYDPLPVLNSDGRVSTNEA